MRFSNSSNPYAIQSFRNILQNKIFILKFFILFMQRFVDKQLDNAQYEFNGYWKIVNYYVLFHFNLVIHRKKLIVSKYSS